MAKRTHQTTPACVLNSRRPIAPSSQSRRRCVRSYLQLAVPAMRIPKGQSQLPTGWRVHQPSPRGGAAALPATAGRRSRMQTNSKAPMAWMATAKCTARTAESANTTRLSSLVQSAAGSWIDPEWERAAPEMRVDRDDAPDHAILPRQAAAAARREPHDRRGRSARPPGPCASRRDRRPRWC